MSESALKSGEENKSHTKSIAKSPPPRCPFRAANISLNKKIRGPQDSKGDFKRVELAFEDGKTVPSKGSAKLLKEIGGGKVALKMCISFYEKFLLDTVLHKFKVENDGAEGHGIRFADWLVEQMGGEGTPATDKGRGDQREWAHVRSYFAKGREPHKQGQRFQLDDCRIWMRLMFWSARQQGLHKHQGFWEWYILFMRYYVDIYQDDAKHFVEESAEWSTNPDNIKEYLDAGRTMEDVIGVTMEDIEADTKKQ
ncbi:hypothetical protein AAMO2058_000008600 [Amorphochlora amoebiformis]|uniref:Uncharacterized protein n=1 Tax=Amorphochlora amoebiformis TaxID=1561963 RepID=A0A7S0GT21_9EUKA|mmetsp:Transcript_1648/g.2338  ORF Transcript_1648/g.2338 Transcript_1648/m.2338 type:complete len:253 (+) Transcript_1648:139-897(+)